MGKQKEHKGDPPVGAFSRMNYLMQAAHLMSQISSNCTLSNYYNKIMKDISKKVVEKLHPDVKRTMCIACSNPLTAGNSEIIVKVKGHRKKLRKRAQDIKRKSTIDNTSKNNLKKYESDRIKTLNCKYKKGRIEVRNKKPNKIKWTCCKCGFAKCFLQKPSYHLWIYNKQDVISADNS